MVNTRPSTKGGLDYRLFSRVMEPTDVKDDGCPSGTAGRRGHAERVVLAKASGLRSNAFAQPGLQK